MKTIIFLIIDFAVFFVLWLGFGVHWIISFFLSTAIVYVGWWVYEWIWWWSNKFARN